MRNNESMYFQLFLICLTESFLFFRHCTQPFSSFRLFSMIIIGVCIFLILSILVYRNRK